MKPVFIDTGYLVALVSPNDTLHIQAISWATRVANCKLVTTHFVLNELLNGAAKRGQFTRQLAIKTIEELQNSSRVEIVLPELALLDSALKLYRDRPDSAWSHTDCISFCVMGDRQIREALAYDRHFEQAGFVALLRQAN
jgi:predicted nucleic acid-binding protein